MTQERLTCGQLVGSPSSDWGIIIGWYEAGNDSSDGTKPSVRWQNRSSQLDMFSAANYGKPFSKVSVLQGVNRTELFFSTEILNLARWLANAFSFFPLHCHPYYGHLRISRGLPWFQASCLLSRQGEGAKARRAKD